MTQGFAGLALPAFKKAGRLSSAVVVAAVNVVLSRQSATPPPQAEGEGEGEGVPADEGGDTAFVEAFLANPEGLWQGAMPPVRMRPQVSNVNTM